MEFSKKLASKFQEGGAMPEGGAPQEQAPAEGGAPAEGQGGGDPMAEILQVASQAVQSENCDAAMAVCQALVQMAQGGAGGGAPEQGQPTYRKGGRLLRRG